MRDRLADDLDAPGAIAAVDEWAAATLRGEGDDTEAPTLVARAVDALLGIEL
jgi:L-cysteine:1D-myo-inositol 2-amino-2-deoxy-alpha-D-glucopyranoside ligase